MNVIHIVSQVSKINLGVWQTAIYGRDALQKLGVQSFFYACEGSTDQIPGTELFEIFETKKAEAGLKELLKKFNPTDTIIISHGSWLKPSRLGNAAARSGYHWVYTPHGMLESWAMSQSGLKKKLFFALVEKKMISRASAIRAVSTSEKENLKKLFNLKVFCIHNGTTAVNTAPKATSSITFLFLARLHPKKGITPLVNAWSQVFAGNSKYRLLIAGPDEGELAHIENYLADNCIYLGPKYGEEKNRLLQSANYFILPSFSEGFSTSILEAMANGAIPIITEACNFPEAFSMHLAEKIEPNVASIKVSLENIRDKSFDLNKSRRNAEFISNNFTEELISKKLILFYKNLLSGKSD